MTLLPDFKLETYFSEWEFKVRFNLCGSDMESISISELLKMAIKEDKELWDNMQLGYTETYGSLALRSAIANTYKNVKPENILVFAGAEEGIFIAMHTLLTQDDHAIVITPNYQSLETIPNSICSVTGIGLDPNKNWHLDINKIKDAIRQNTRLISINFPHNPTGKIISENEFHSIVKIAEEKDIYLFSDEVYRLMEREKSLRLPQAADIYQKGLSLNVMSKAYGMPGLRIGWIALRNKKILSKMERLKHYLSICNSAPSEILATIALNSKENILERNKKIVADNLIILNQFFHKYPNLFDWNEPDGACIGYPKYHGEGDVEFFCKKLVKKTGVLLLPSSMFQSNVSPTPTNHFRIGYGKINMKDGLMALQEFLSKK